MIDGYFELVGAVVRQAIQDKIRIDYLSKKKSINRLEEYELDELNCTPPDDFLFGFLSPYIKEDFMREKIKNMKTRCIYGEKRETEEQTIEENV